MLSRCKGVVNDVSGRCSARLGSQGKKDKFLLFLIPGEVCSQVVPGSLESPAGKKRGEDLET